MEEKVLARILRGARPHVFRLVYAGNPEEKLANTESFAKFLNEQSDCKNMFDDLMRLVKQIYSKEALS